jgi:hypothetical protein
MERAMYDEHIKSYRKMAQDLINKHGEQIPSIEGINGEKLNH